MSTSIRFALLTLSMVLLVASCGQKGPLTLPEEGASATAAGAPALPQSTAAHGSVATPVDRNP